MLIKAADDKAPLLAELEALLERPDLDADRRARIEQEIRTTSAGWKGERDAAYEIEFHFGKNQNFVTLHDLRLEHDGLVAQIDHLVISRLLQVWICESKSFSEGVSISAHGEWSSWYKGRPYGIASPVEQNRKHIAVLKRLFEADVCPLPRRLGLRIMPSFSPLVLVSNNARISRPKGRVDGVDTVIKAEKIRDTIHRQFDDRTHRMLRVVGKDTLERFGRDPAALHRPVTFDWAARFGLPAAAATPTPAKGSAPECVSCGRELSRTEAFFCRINKDRFGGRYYCRECRKSVPAPAPTGESGA